MSEVQELTSPFFAPQPTDPTKTAVVLAGGGISGIVYEAGALQAINEVLNDRTVNDFDHYVGTSAGAVVAAFLANGITPDMILSAATGSHPEVRPFARRDLWQFQGSSLLRSLAAMPARLASTGYEFLRNPRDASLFNLIWSALDTLPPALYDSANLENYLRETLTALGGSNNFRELEKELDIVATDLSNGQRMVFNRENPLAVPISLAASASGAVPIVYNPVPIGPSEYVDGALRGNASIDLAIERGAGLIICINSLVPHQQEAGEDANLDNPNDSEGRLSEAGMQTVLSQTLRTMMHAGIAYHVKQLRREHPDVTILLIEPDMEDNEMSFDNVMSHAKQEATAVHARSSVIAHFLAHETEYRAMLEKHGLALKPRAYLELAEVDLSL
jgi:NTE family protein